jgi:hypothetical protein
LAWRAEWGYRAIHPRIEDLLRRCLEKDVKGRLQAIADIRVEIETIPADPHGLKSHPPLADLRPLWRRAIPFVVTALAVAAAAVAAAWRIWPEVWA